MDREITGVSMLLDALSTIDEMMLARRERCNILYSLASTVKSGNIVELGVFHGVGLISLYYGMLNAAAHYYGARLPVIGVDSYSDRTGWAGEKYSIKDLDICIENMRKLDARASVVVSDFASASLWMRELSVGLLVWDAGTYDSEVDIYPWKNTIISGGFIVFHDTDDGKLGTYETIHRLTHSGEFAETTSIGHGMNYVRRR